MIAIIVITLLALIGAVFTLYVRQGRSTSGNDQPLIPAPHLRRGLFDPSETTQLAIAREARTGSEEKELLERSMSGDLSALTDASAQYPNLYYGALDALVRWAATRQENLTALVSHVSKSNELRANRQLARLFIENWKKAPNRLSTTEMIHIAALSDDPETYGEALDAALELWKTGQLSGFKPEELTELFVSQYWVMAAEARRGGSGYALKRRLLGVRRELAPTTSTR